MSHTCSNWANDSSITSGPTQDLTIATGSGALGSVSDARQIGGLAKTGRALESLASLPPNWDSYGAAPANLRSLATAFDLAVCLHTLGSDRQPLVSLTPDGMAALTWEWNDGRCSLDVEVRPDGSLAYALVVDNQDDADREGVTGDPGTIAELIR